MIHFLGITAKNDNGARQASQNELLSTYQDSGSE